MDASELSTQIQQQNQRALARAISHVENGTEIGTKLLDMLYSNNRPAQVIGITGPPGSGKSTLVDQLLNKFRDDDLKIGIIALDPSSPFSGGAILGDRVRMLRFSSDPNVYIRSMASRGALGGLSNSTFDTITLYQAFGFDKIVVETVGAGQSEVDIVKNADTTIVLAVPGLGDEIQIIKAGIMEIADIFAVNKADLPGADGLSLQIKNMLELVPAKTEWSPPIVKTNALDGTGVSKLIEAITNHWEHLKGTGKLSEVRHKQMSHELMNKVYHQIRVQIEEEGTMNTLVSSIQNNEIRLTEAIEKLKLLY